MNKATSVKISWLIIAVAILLTIITTSCDGTQKGLKGKWMTEYENGRMTIDFKSNKVALIISNDSVAEEVIASGKYIVTDSKMEFELSGNPKAIAFPNAISEGEIFIFDYTINGDTLTLISKFEEIEFTKMK